MPIQMPGPMQTQSQPQVQGPRGPNGFQPQTQSPSTPTAYAAGGSNNSLPSHEGPPSGYGSQQPYPQPQPRDNGDYGIHNTPPPHPIQQQPYTPVPASPYTAPTPHAPSPRGPVAAPYTNSPSQMKQVEPDFPPVKPVFGISLEDLFDRDGSAVPMVVNQCLQAIDLFGLEAEGIFRIPGNAIHIGKLRALFDNGEPLIHVCLHS